MRAIYRIIFQIFLLLFQHHPGEINVINICDKSFKGQICNLTINYQITNGFRVSRISSQLLPHCSLVQTGLTGFRGLTGFIHQLTGFLKLDNSIFCVQYWILNRCLVFGYRSWEKHHHTITLIKQPFIVYRLPFIVYRLPFTVYLQLRCLALNLNHLHFMLLELNQPVH